MSWQHCIQTHLCHNVYIYTYKIYLGEHIYYIKIYWMQNIYTYVHIYFRYSAQDIQCVRMKGNVVNIHSWKARGLPFPNPRLIKDILCNSLGDVIRLCQIKALPTCSSYLSREASTRGISAKNQWTQSLHLVVHCHLLFLILKNQRSIADSIWS